MGKDLECQAKGLALFLVAVGNHLTFLAVELQD